MSIVGKVLKLAVAYGAARGAYSVIKLGTEQEKRKRDRKLDEKAFRVHCAGMSDGPADTTSVLEPQAIDKALAQLKKNCKGLKKKAGRLTDQLSEFIQVAEANGGQIPDINEIAQEIIGPRDNPPSSEQQEELQEMYKRWFDPTYDGRMDTLRKHWSDSVVMTDDCSSETSASEVEKENLLPGELSAVTFQIGCYTIRSAQRVYKIQDSAYDPENEPPADEADLVRVRAEINRPIQSFRDEFRVVHEISARYKADPKGMFSFVCRAAEARNYSWRESIEAVCTVKENASTPDEDASLLILNTYMGDSFSVDTWYKVDPSGSITTLKLHPYDSDINNARFE